MPSPGAKPGAKPGAESEPGEYGGYAAAPLRHSSSLAKIRNGRFNRNKRTPVTGTQAHGRNRSRQLKIEDVAPWERQPDESPEAYRAFCCYRDAPGMRGYSHVAKTLRLSRIVIARHGAAHHWIERAAAWDFHIERARLVQTENMQVEMAQRHAEVAMLMISRVRRRLNHIDFKKLDAKTVSAWLDVGVKVERLSRGLSSYDAPGGKGVIKPVGEMSDAEIISTIAALGNNSQMRRLESAKVGEVIDVKAETVAVKVAPEAQNQA